MRNQQTESTGQDRRTDGSEHRPDPLPGRAVDGGPDRCPSCGVAGRKVKRKTLDSLLRPACRSRIAAGAYRVCLNPDCAVVYFPEWAASGSQEGAAEGVFGKADLAVRFGLKETTPPRPVCYCFGHSVESIEAEVRKTGRSTAVERIQEAMEGDGCRCEVTNPAGSCCLKSVRRVVADVCTALGHSDAVEAAAGADCRGADGAADCCAESVIVSSDCCGADADCSAAEAAGGTAGYAAGGDSADGQAGGIGGGRRKHGGMWAVGGSILAAALSSACCWLPLLLIGLGVSAGGVAVFFEASRPYLIVGAILMLGVGYYIVYFRRTDCCADASCATSSRRRVTFNRAMLGVATVLVAAFVFFPNYVGRLIGAPPAATGAAGADDAAGGRLVTARFRVEGMTCEGCANLLAGRLAKVPGVAGTTVDYPTRTAEVTTSPEVPVPVDQIIQAARDGGYALSPQR